MTDYDDIENQVDWVLTRVFPVASMIACGVAALYFGAHLVVALVEGWL
jgi:hypothetical protein